MQITTISCGRTYNTTHYTSQRFDFTATLQNGDRIEDAMRGLADALHATALEVMRDQGVKYIVEPGGTIDLTRTAPDNDEESDGQEIPF